MVMKRQIEVTAAEENTRLTLLEDCERKIVQGFRRGLEASLFIAEQFKKINDMELYQERGYTNFNAYCVGSGMDLRTVGRILTSLETAKNFKAHGLELPGNESQLMELARLEPDRQIVVWQQCKIAAEQREEPVTVETVRQAVELARREQPKSPAAGVRTALDEPDLDLSSIASDDKPGPSKRPTESSRISLSEDGESNLERIRRACGDMVADAIERKRLQMSERELELWAHHPDPPTLKHYIVDLGWSVTKAIGFETQTIDDRTTVSKLRALTHAHGGNFQVEVDSLKISLEVPI